MSEVILTIYNYINKSDYENLLWWIFINHNWRKIWYSIFFIENFLYDL